MMIFHRPAVLLDVGVKRGASSLPVLQLHPQHTLIAVEPVNENLDALCCSALRVTADKRNRFHLVHTALIEKPTNAEWIYIPSGREGHAALSAKVAASSHRHATQAFTVTVRGDALLAVLNIQSDIINVSTLSSELRVLIGLRGYLKKARHVLVIVSSNQHWLNGAGNDPGL